MCCLIFFCFLQAAEMMAPNENPVLLCSSKSPSSSRKRTPSGEGLVCTLVALRHSLRDIRLLDGQGRPTGATVCVLGWPLGCFVIWIREALAAAGMDQSKYSGYSFCIRAATTVPTKLYIYSRHWAAGRALCISIRCESRKHVPHL
jgi:hypothetical protein